MMMNLNLMIGVMNNQNEEKYWFTKDKIDRIALIHNYLDSFLKLEKFYHFHQLLMWQHH